MFFIPDNTPRIIWQIWTDIFHPPLEHLIILFSKTASLLLPYEPSAAPDQPSPNRQRSQSLAGSTVNSNFNLANIMVPRPQSYLSPCGARRSASKS